MSDMTYKEIGKTMSWNFQDGCRLQWLDSENVIYNVRRGTGVFGSVVYYTASDRIVKMYDSPVYTISKQHCKAVFYSLANNKYSYAHTEADESNDPVRDGIYILDMKSEKAELLIRNEDISSTQ